MLLGKITTTLAYDLGGLDRRFLNLISVLSELQQIDFEYGNKPVYMIADIPKIVKADLSTRRVRR
jgi:hypothetical protein